MRILHVLPYLIGITAVFITFSSKIQLRSLLEGLENFRFFEATQADNSTTRASPRKRQYTEATDGASFSLNIKAFLSHQTPGNTPRNQQEQQRWLNMTNAPLRSAIGNNFVEGMRCEQHHQHRVTYSTTSSPRTKISALTAWTYSMTHVCLNQYGRMYYFPPQSHASEQQVVILRNEIRQKIRLVLHPIVQGKPAKKRTDPQHRRYVFESGPTPVYLLRWEKNYHHNIWHSLHRLAPMTQLLTALNMTNPENTEIVHSITRTETFLNNGTEERLNFVRDLMPMMDGLGEPGGCHSLHVHEPGDKYAKETLHTLRCFRDVVIGWPSFLSGDPKKNFSQVRRRFLRMMTSDDSGSETVRKSRIASNNRVRHLTLIHRTGGPRKIINIDEVTSGLVNLTKGTVWRVEVVNFATLTLLEQARVAVKTSVLIGITGAGLTWQFMMSKGSAVVEICPYAKPIVKIPKIIKDISMPANQKRREKRNPGSRCNLEGVGINVNNRSWYGSIGASVGLTHVAYVTQPKEIVNFWNQSVVLNLETLKQHVLIAMEAVENADLLDLP